MSNVTEVLYNNKEIYDGSGKNKKSNEVNKDMFLKLLITQMQNQDPLNPMEDREFIAQMAQFTSLEQMQNLNDTLKNTQLSVMDHITQMNNNMVKSQSTIAGTLDSINLTMRAIANKFNINIVSNEKAETPKETASSETVVKESNEA